jgi:hypothetical protein
VLGPHDLARGVHAHGGLLAAQLDHDAALVVAENELVGALEVAQSPDALHAVVEGLLQTIGVGVPQPVSRVCREKEKASASEIGAHATRYSGARRALEVSWW